MSPHAAKAAHEQARCEWTMKKVMRATACGFSVGLMVTTALAQQPVTNSAFEPRAYCRAWLNYTGSATDAFSRGACVGTVEAIFFMMGEFPAEHRYSRCLPEN